MESIRRVDISVVSPTYKRPQMLKDLILSYLYQSYPYSELVIIDDGINDLETETIVKDYAQKDNRIRYVKNPINLGYSKNLRKAIMEGCGKYIVTLGDDDILLHRDALKKYVEVFETHPKVGFIYSNILQFNNHYKMDFVYRYFKQDTLFDTSEYALRSIWLNSCFISGIGLRKRDDFLNLYPKEDWLFPQVEFVGKILMRAQGYGIADFLIGGRAHEEQLGFKSVQGRDIKKNERHSSIELLEIFDRLKFYCEADGISFKLNNEFVKEFFIRNHASILPAEKINTGNRALLRVFVNAVKKNKKILVNPRYMFYMIASLILPRKILSYLKNTYKKHLIKRKWKNESEYFRHQIKGMGVI